MVTKPKSAEMIPGPGYRVRHSIERPSKEVIEGYRTFDSADISDMLNRMYTMDPKIYNTTTKTRLVGPACTVKVFPGDNLMVHRCLDIAQPGDVVVVDTSNCQTNAVIGDMILMKAKHRKIAGFIIDGLVRDVEAMREVGLPVFATGITPFGPLHRGPGELNYSVSCGGIVVNPGDVIVADSDGVVVVRREFAADVLGRLEHNRERMADYVQAIKDGNFSNEWVGALLEKDGCLNEE
jgi:RraA family protein